MVSMPSKRKLKMYLDSAKRGVSVHLWERHMRIICFVRHFASEEAICGRKQQVSVLHSPKRDGHCQAQVPRSERAIK
jgi:hypothetical protein